MNIHGWLGCRNTQNSKTQRTDLFYPKNVQNYSWGFNCKYVRQDWKTQDSKLTSKFCFTGSSFWVSSPQSCSATMTCRRETFYGGWIIGSLESHTLNSLSLTSSSAHITTGVLTLLTTCVNGCMTTATKTPLIFGCVLTTAHHQNRRYVQTLWISCRNNNCIMAFDIFVITKEVYEM